MNTRPFIYRAIELLQVRLDMHDEHSWCRRQSDDRYYSNGSHKRDLAYGAKLAQKQASLIKLYNDLFWAQI